MKNWLRKILGLEFPEPKQHNMAIQDMLRFWEKKMNDRWRSECELVVYRMDPALAPFESMIKLRGYNYQTQFIRPALDGAIQSLTPTQEWLNEHLEVEKVVFLIRMQRTWKTEYGSRTKEVCISSFEVNTSR